ncbi:fructose-2,6-bisphosphatase TIGAR B-like [Apostichopus japonicus]|uniref:fructose-2,6-bisphosphatase TIGAR B-like n=1 Tax=Stichopus japonicus TaxID=307972 RepID=UPI003AB4519D
MFKVTFIRHGETEYNANGLFQGQSDIPLNSLGEKQAEAAGAYLKNIKFDRIYSSDLIRCIQTADAVVKRNSCSPPGIIEDARLREKSFGIFEGKPFHEYHNWTDANGGRNSTIPEGETEEEVIFRMESFLDHLCQDMTENFVKTSSFTTVTSDDITTQDEATTREARTDDEPLTFNEIGYPPEMELPHVLLSSHGMFLRILLQVLRKRYICQIPKGMHIYRRCPNTGLSGFIFKLTDGKPSHVDYKFVFCDHHLGDD